MSHQPLHGRMFHIYVSSRVPLFSTKPSSIYGAVFRLQSSASVALFSMVSSLSLMVVEIFDLDVGSLVGSIQDCQGILQIMGIGYALAIPATSLLFLLRIAAVFSGNRIVISFFTFAWLGVLACAISLPFSLIGSHIGPTRNCIISNVKAFSSAGMIASTIFDSFVFFAISWRLVRTPDIQNNSGLQEKARTFCSGGTFPSSSLSMSLLRSGQVYYL